MKKLLKTISTLIASVAFIFLFLLTLSFKSWTFPFIMGLLGIALLLLIAIDFKLYKKEWKSFCIIGTIGIFFIFGAGQIFCNIYNAPSWLFNICRMGVLLSLILGAVIICAVVFLSTSFFKRKS